MGECAGNCLRKAMAGTYAQGSPASGCCSGCCSGSLAARALSLPPWPRSHSSPTRKGVSTHATRCNETKGNSMKDGHRCGIGDVSSESARIACRTQSQVITPSHKKGGEERRRSRPLFATSRSDCHAFSEDRNERLTVSPSGNSQAGMSGLSQALPPWVNGQEHCPVSWSQFPRRVQPAGHFCREAMPRC